MAINFKTLSLPTYCQTISETMNGIFIFFSVVRANWDSISFVTDRYYTGPESLLINWHRMNICQEMPLQSCSTVVLTLLLQIRVPSCRTSGQYCAPSLPGLLTKNHPNTCFHLPVHLHVIDLLSVLNVEHVTNYMPSTNAILCFYGI